MANLKSWPRRPPLAEAARHADVRRMSTLVVAALALLAALAVALVVVVVLFRRPLQRRANRIAARAVLRSRTRIDRFKLTGRHFVRARLLSDPAVAEAVRDHVAETGMPEADTWRKVDGYVREIVPFFNIIAYYEIGFRISRWVLSLLYKVTVDYEDRAKIRALPRDAVACGHAPFRSNRSSRRSVGTSCDGSTASDSITPCSNGTYSSSRARV
jgi:hypothetical protein